MPRHPRVHRLPQRLDYALIPAPLDLTLPERSEKHPLPAIIVTPSSPTHHQDFSIAFLAPPPKPTLRQRIVTYAKAHSPAWGQSKFQLPETASTQWQPSTLNMRARMTLIVLLLLFIMACHLLTHRLAAHHAHLDFTHSFDPDSLVAVQGVHAASALRAGDVSGISGSGGSGGSDSPAWFTLAWFWGNDDADVVGSRTFVVRE